MKILQGIVPLSKIFVVVHTHIVEPLITEVVEVNPNVCNMDVVF